MAKNVDDLVIGVRAEVSDAIRKLKLVADTSASTGKRVKAAFGAAASGISALTKGFGAYGLAVEGAKKALAPFNKIMDHMNSTAGLSKMARRIGVNVEKLQELSFAAKSTGVDTETLADAMKDLNVKITDAANGAASYEEVFNLIGLRSKELLTLPVDKQFERFADAMAKVDEQTRRFVADEINDSMFQLNDLLAKGSSGLSDFAAEARSLNAVMSETDIKKMEDTVKEVNKMKVGLEAILNEVLKELGPIMTAFLRETVSGLKEINRWLGNNLSLQEIETQLMSKREELAKHQRKMETANARFRVSNLAKEKELLDEIIELQVKAGRIRMQKESESEVAIPTVRTGGSTGGSDINKMFAEALSGGKDLTNFRGSGEKDEDTGSTILEAPSVIEEEMARLEEALHNKEVAKLEAERRLNEEMQAIRDNEYAAEEYQTKRIIALAQGSNRDKLRLAQGMANDLLAISKGSSRKLFEVSKALGIADATVSAITGATNAYRDVPYPMNIAASAAVLAAGMANVQRIASTEFNSGGGGGGGASGVGAGNSEAQAPREVVQTTNFDVTLQGDSFSGDQVRGLIGAINEATDDGVKLNAVLAR